MCVGGVCVHACVYAHTTCLPTSSGNVAERKHRVWSALPRQSAFVCECVPVGEVWVGGDGSSAPEKPATFCFKGQSLWLLYSFDMGISPGLVLLISLQTVILG